MPADTESKQVVRGLEGVAVAETSISRIDGRAGKLIYRGYSIDELAGKASFEEVAYLLWNGELPTRSRLDDLTSRMAASWDLPDRTFRILEILSPGGRAMEVLRTAVSSLSADDVDAESNEEAANRAKAIRLTVQIPRIVATYARLRKGKKPVDPVPDRSIAENFLRMLRGEEAEIEPIETRALDVALVLHADHGFNASTFSCRVTVATLSDLHSGVTSAIGTLKGPLHGGANTKVMEMLDRIGDGDPAEWVRKALARKERIMGFGHRVYKVKDPRAYHLERLSKELCEKTGNRRLFEMSQVIEKTVKEEKGLAPNVDFYSASTYHCLGIEKDLFTPIFAMSRVVGWTAHALEQFADNRLIRPSSVYVGPEGKTFIPIEERGK